MYVDKPCSNINFDFESGDIFTEEIGPIIEINRTYFDCGVYYFDGRFNVVKFPKNMIIYHGSGNMVRYNSEYPVGINYYDKTNSVNINSIDLRRIGEPNFSIYKEISSLYNIDASWFGNLDIGKLYSNREPDKDICGNDCVLAYKLKNDISMILLGDDYNIAKILFDPNVPQNIKIHLMYMYSITDPSNFDIVEDSIPFNRIRYFEKNRRSVTDNDKKVVNWLCNKYIKTGEYSGIAGPPIKSTFHGDVFHLELIFCNAIEHLVRDLENVNDWQYNSRSSQIPPYVKIYIEQLKIYKTLNINFHAGDLYEHSVWSLLYTEYLMKYIFDITRYINLPEDELKYFSKMIGVSAFLHDIGKLQYDNTSFFEYPYIFYYSKEDHPFVGYEYLKKTMDYCILDENFECSGDILDIDNLINDFGISLDADSKQFIRIMSLLHWEFGDVLKDYNNNPTNLDNYAIEYINKVFSVLDTYNEIIPNEQIYLYFYGLIVISIGDILASQSYSSVNNYPFVDLKKRNGRFNKYSELFPYISNVPKTHAGGDVVERSNLTTTGFQLANIVLNIIRTRY